MTCQKCVESIEKSLLNLKGIEVVDVSLERGTVVVKSNLPHEVIQEKIEISGRRAVFKGYGGRTIKQFYNINNEFLKNQNVFLS